jgi:hypothetical protein
MPSKKPKIGTIIKKTTEAVGIEACSNCETRAFQMDRWTHKKPICKIDCKDCESFNSADANIPALYLKYFGLDNSNTKSEKVKEIMLNDLNKLFNDAN